MDVLMTLFPEVDEGSMWGTLAVGMALLVVVSATNVLVVRNKVMGIWKRKDWQR